VTDYAVGKLIKRHFNFVRKLNWGDENNLGVNIAIFLTKHTINGLQLPNRHTHRGKNSRQPLHLLRPSIDTATNQKLHMLRHVWRSGHDKVDRQTKCAAERQKIIQIQAIRCHRFLEFGGII
jgi:hypothetical protein